MLNEAEKAQLGTINKLSRKRYRFVTELEWKRLREMMVAKSLKAGADKELCAYTPGETLALMNNMRIKDWHAGMMAYRLPSHVDRVAFVPCAKTKPWLRETVGRSQLYRAYWSIIDSKEFPRTMFVTISEPLGIVPQPFWGSFPPYDNPGLFKNHAQRSGMMRKDWIKFFGKVLYTPFDEAAYNQCIEILGNIIKMFVKNHPHIKFVSFVDSRKGEGSSHEDMIENIESIKRFKRKIEARKSPIDHIRRVLSEN